jgi:hypothetical protein
MRILKCYPQGHLAIRESGSDEFRLSRIPKQAKIEWILRHVILDQQYGSVRCG